MRVYGWVLAALLLAACGDEDAAATGPQDMGRADMAADLGVMDQGTDQGADLGADQGVSPDDMAEAPDLAEDASPDLPPAPDMSGPPAPYVGAGDVYTRGALMVARREVTAGTNGLPVNALVVAPQQAGGYPVVVFQHGFLLSVLYYTELFEHIASHGFVVVAPQMYAADGNPIGKPSTTEEAEDAAAVRLWAVEHVDAAIGYEPRVESLGLIGHSRGGKVIWRQLKATPAAADAVVGVDPVDGTGGPLGGDTRVISGAFTYGAPTLVIGAGLGSQPLNAFAPACAPTNDNHVQFYAAAPAPAWHATVTDYGHLDMLNDSTAGCGFTCSSCKSGETRAPMRTTTGGLIVAFLRASLQGDASAYGLLTQPRSAPASFAHESK